MELSGTNIYQQICNLSAFLPFSSELRFYLAARIRCYTPDRLSNEFRPIDWGGGGGGGGAGKKKDFFSALRASLWSNNKGGRAPTLDPPLSN